MKGVACPFQLHERTFDLEFESVGVWVWLITFAHTYLRTHLKYRPDVVVVVQRPEKSQEKSQDEHNRNNEFQQYNGWDVKKVC